MAFGDIFKDQTLLAGSERRQCIEVRKLEGIVNLVNDVEEFAQFESRHNLTQSEIDDIKAQALAETERLKTLQANATLMQQCASLEAGREIRADCRDMRRLTEVASLADNKTALQEFQTKHDLPEEWIMKLTEKAANATVRLEQLKENSTLVAACEADTQAQLQAGESSWRQTFSTTAINADSSSSATNTQSSQGLIAEATAATYSLRAVGNFMLVAALTAAFFMSS